MSDKPTQFEDVQLNDAELDQVVGGQEVLSLQLMGADLVSSCSDSSVSCESTASCKSSASSKAAETL
jgi:hypothetical protein